MEIKTNLPEKIKNNNTFNLLETKIKETDDVKNAINLLATKTALEQDGTIEKLVNEKTAELKNDAEAKKVKSETDKINEEVNKVRAEKEKQLAEFDKEIEARKKEVEQLKAESDKATEYFNSNKEILKYIGIRNKKSLGVMKTLMYPATLIFVIVQILLFPLTLCGVVIENVVNIIGGICGAIKNNALKIILSVALVLVILAVLFLTYFYGGKLIGNIRG